MKFIPLTFILFAKLVNCSEVICDFHDLTYWGYTCTVENQKVFDNSIVKFNIDDIEKGKSYNDVDCVEFFESEIDFLPEEIFSTFNFVSRIIFMNNNFKQWQGAHLKGGKNLIAFVIADNSLESLENFSFKHSPKLQILALYNNSLVDIFPKAFNGLKDLKTLQLSDNKLNYLHENVFRDLESLNELDLFDNNLSLLQLNIFSGNKKLKTLRLDGNKITAIAGGVFERSSNIVSLNLTNNLISTIDAAVLPLKLEVIYVGKFITVICHKLLITLAISNQRAIDS